MQTAAGAHVAREIVPGTALWTLVEGELRQTYVTQVSSHLSWDLVEVVTAKGNFCVTGDHPLATPQGWIEARHAQGCLVEWAQIPTTQSASLPALARLGQHTWAGALRGRSILLLAADTAAEPTGESWQEKHGFEQQEHRTSLRESAWVPVEAVRSCGEENGPATVYSWKCEPYPTFLLNGHLTHNCEHHLMPFWCDVSIGYITGNKVLGLSKFARIAQQCAHRLQLQERLGQQIADEVSRITQTEDVAVVLTGEHLCMTARGIRTPGLMTSSVMRGVFRAESETRMEFLQLIK
ncbi:hypothetical protein EPA93_47285 [Ktedonosporobacter rubrisoli]|uniref:GTP cyclohydrolase I n=2 Tax=Ktedonosporobacter rubrisoli TaxID=2509675 RepID=A0A4P6K6C2_KTERU|nr:hypothetical protein EPA93_47285 [Ktedonosporobacter rubrisoli]